MTDKPISSIRKFGMVNNRRWWMCLAVALLPLGAPVQAKKKEVRQVVIQEVTRVEGKIQKPEVWYLLPRSNLNFQSIELKKDLAPRIEESVNKAPF